MSFLSHLAARAAQGAGAVQPRLPALFEPPPASPVFGDLSTPGRREPRDEERPAESPAAGVPETPRRRAPAPPPAVSLAPRDEPAGTAPPRAERRRSAPPPETAEPEPALFSRPVARPDRTVVAMPRPAAERPAPPAPPAPGPHGVLPAEPPRREQEVRPALTQDVRSATEPSRPSPPAPPSPVTPLPAPAPVLARPAVTALAPRREPPAQRLEASEPAPVIRVTIGRIEVRAMPPAAASSAPAAPAETRRGSGPSLEDYLQRRSGAGRD